MSQPGQIQVWLRDTTFGWIVHHATRRRFLRHEEETDDFVCPEVFKRPKRLPINSRAAPATLDEGEAEKGRRKDGKASERQQTDHSVLEHHESRRSFTRGSDETVVGEPPPAGPNGDEIFVGWYGDLDPANPRNWPVPRKCFVTFCICLITLAVYMGSSIVTSGFDQAMQELHVGQVPITLAGLSCFVYGYAIGPLFVSPLSEIPSVGRSLPYIVSVGIFVLLQIPLALTNNYALFLVLRFLSGFFGSPPLATGGASIIDMFDQESQPIAIGLWSLSAATGPALGPIISGFAVEHENWKWYAWELLWFAGFAWLVLFFFLPETSHDTILLRRAKRLRRITGNEHLKSQAELDQHKLTPRDLLIMTLIRPLRFTLFEPILVAVNIYLGFIYALLYCFFESFPLVYGKKGFYGFEIGVQSLFFLPMLVGAILSYIGYIIWSQKSYVPKLRRSGGKLAPEARLPPAQWAAFLYPCCLIPFAWSAGRTHWAAPMMFSSLFGLGATFLFQSILNFVPDAYANYAASALASNDFARAMIAGSFPLFATAMFKRLGIDWGNTLLGLISLVMIPIPFVLHRYGPALRKRSKYAS